MAHHGRCHIVQPERGHHNQVPLPRDDNPITVAPSNRHPNLTALGERRMHGNGHVRCGRRPGETAREKPRHRASGRSHVLSAPMARTLILVSRAHRDALFAFRWSLAVETEADRHTRPGQRTVASLRQMLDWDSMLVADVTSTQQAGLVDASVEDRHVVASAYAAHAQVVVTRNVPSFGCTDLTATTMAAVRPDLFLASTLSDAMYLDALTQMSAARTSTAEYACYPPRGILIRASPPVRTHETRVPRCRTHPQSP